MLTSVRAHTPEVSSAAVRVLSDLDLPELADLCAVDPVGSVLAATRVEAARLLVEQAARKYDSGARCDLEAGMAKLFASEAAVSNSLDAMRVFGGYSYSVDFDVERYYRDAPLMCIGEGTNEMQRIIIARQLAERHPA